MFFALIFDAKGNGVGTHVYAEQPQALPSNQIACTQDQSQNPQSWSIVNGNLIQNVESSQADQISLLKQSYATAIAQTVTYTSKGGVTKTYQADPGSISNLQNMLLAFQAAAAVPAGFYWVAADNTQVPFTYADMQGLAQTIGAQGAAAFQHLQTLKAKVLAATTVSAVQAITW